MMDLNKEEGIVHLNYADILDTDGPYISDIPKGCKWVNDELNKRLTFLVPVKRLTFDNGL